MKIEQYYSDDYAGLVANNMSFYYGYEETDQLTDDWCFCVKKDGEEIFRTTRTYIENSVESTQLYMPQDYLLSGIAIWLLYHKQNKND